MSQVAVNVVGLWKQYTIGWAAQRQTTFYDVLAESLSAPLRRFRGLRADPSRDFQALQDVSFDVHAGDVVGIIGANGAGKSTLLKVLSRITAPTRGRVTIRGRLASLLEVGTGFHPELSGRENIFLNGAILGMTRAEVRQRFDEIVDFAEVEKFIDTPVKRYSSGMYVRLAFAVAANLDADVLLVDEVLAVGDAGFQEKCLNRMGSLSRGGRTVLFVSHSHGAVSRLCSRCIVLGNGKVSFDGSVRDGLAHYNAMLTSSDLVAGMGVEGQLARKLRIEGFAVNDSERAAGHVYEPASGIRLRVTGAVLEPIASFRITFCIMKSGQLILGMHDQALATDIATGRVESEVTIPPFTLSPGEYIVDIGAYSTKNGDWMMARNIGGFAISPSWYPLYEPSHAMGVFNLPQAGTRRSCAR